MLLPSLKFAIVSFMKCISYTRPPLNSNIAMLASLSVIFGSKQKKCVFDNLTHRKKIES